MKTGPSLAKALRLAKAARGGRLKDREGVAKPSPIGIFWSSLSRGVFALETAKAVPPYQGGADRLYESSSEAKHEGRQW